MSKKNFYNNCHLEGLLYDHNLELKTTGPNSKAPGTEYIRGTVSIVTDNALTNVVTVYYNYVTAMTRKGKEDLRFKSLMEIISGKRKTVMADGADMASIVRVDSSLALNEFFTERDGKEELVSAKRNEGGFLHFEGSGENGKLDPEEGRRDTFKVDMVITNAIEKEAIEERNLPAKVIVKGWIFDFRGAIYPVEFSAVDGPAMDYFLGLGASPKEPFCTQVWGHQVSETVVRRIVTENAFGPDDVQELTSTRKEYLIEGSANNPYEWDSEDFITAAEFNQKMTERETYLADIKKRRDDYRNSQKTAAETIANPAHADFKF